MRPRSQGNRVLVFTRGAYMSIQCRKCQEGLGDATSIREVRALTNTHFRESPACTKADAEGGPGVDFIRGHGLNLVPRGRRA